MMHGQKSTRRTTEIVLISGGMILLRLPMATATAATLPIAVGFHTDAKGFVVLLGMAVVGAGLGTSRLWMAKTSKRP